MHFQTCQGCVYLLTCTCVTALCVLQCAGTCARKLLWWRGEQQFVGHVTRTCTAGYARLLVAALYPVWQPLHVAVTVQGVGTESPATRKTRQRRVKTMFSYDNTEQSALFHFKTNVLKYWAKTYHCNHKYLWLHYIFPCWIIVLEIIQSIYLLLFTVLCFSLYFNMFC